MDLVYLPHSGGWTLSLLKIVFNQPLGFILSRSSSALFKLVDSQWDGIDGP